MCTLRKCAAVFLILQSFVSLVNVTGPDVTKPKTVLPVMRIKGRCSSIFRYNIISRRLQVVVVVIVAVPSTVNYSTDYTMLRLTGVVCTSVYVTILCSHSA